MKMNEVILHRVLLNQAQIMLTLSVITKDKEIKKILVKLVDETMSMLNDLK